MEGARRWCRRGEGVNGSLGLGIGIGLIALIVGLVSGFLIRQAQERRQAQARQAEAEGILGAARAKAREIELSARDEALRLRDEAEAEASRRRAELGRGEEALQRRRTELDRRVEQIEKRDQQLNKRQSTLDRRENELDTLHQQTVQELQRVSGMSQEEAKAQLLAEVERDSRADMVRVIRQIEEEAQAEGERRARELIADAIQRVASEHVAEVTA